MKTKSKYFLGLTILTSSLFLFCCFSIIFYVLRIDTVPESQKVENGMAFVFLFLHLIIVAFAIYMSLKAYIKKSQLLIVIMTNEHGTKNPKSYRNTLIFSIIFGIFGLWFFLNSFGILHIMKFFSLCLNLALTNVGLFIFSVTLYMHFYEPPAVEEIPKE